MKNRLRESFTQVNNSVLNSKELSLKAKGLYAFLCSKPDNWKFSYKGLSAQLQEGEKSIRSGVKELVMLKILIRIPVISIKEDGSKYFDYDWIINPTPTDLENNIDPLLNKNKERGGTPNGDHPNGDHPNGDHPNGDHPNGDHIDNNKISNNNKEINKNIIINNNITETEVSDSSTEIIEEEFGNQDINKMQFFIQTEVELSGYIYKPGKQERNRIRNILTAKLINDIAKKHNMNIYEFVGNIFKLSNKLEFWNGKINNAETFYKYFDKIYNDGLSLKIKHNSKNIDYGAL